MSGHRKFADLVRDTAEEAKEAEHAAALSSMKSEIAALKRARTGDAKRYGELQEQFDFVQRIESEHSKPPAWASPKRKVKSHSAILSLVLSDLHLDEVVDPAEVEELNAYNRDIARQRIERCVEKTIMLSRDYISGVKYDGLCLMLGGDIVSGFIHEELAQTNEACIPATVEYWIDHLSAAVGTLADEFGKVHVPCVVGNHGRLTIKPRAKRRVTDNIDWLIYRLIARDFKNDSRVTFQIPYGTDTNVKIYNNNFLLTHGDQFKGGGGIGGVYNPLSTGSLRKAKRAMQVDKTWDYIVMGHWHTYSAFRNIIVNGSTKGLDEYAYVGNFDYEPAQQALWVNTPEHGISMSAAVKIQDRAKEGW